MKRVYYGVNYLKVQTDAMKDKDTSPNTGKWFPVTVPDAFDVGYSDGRFIVVIPKDHFYLHYEEKEVLHIENLFNVDVLKMFRAFPAEIIENGKFKYRKITTFLPDVCDPVYINEAILKKYFYSDLLDFYISGEKQPVYLAKKDTCAVVGIILPCTMREEDE